MGGPAHHDRDEPPDLAGVTDPTDPAAREATIAQLRNMLAEQARGETAPPEDAAGAPAPTSHEEWVEKGREVALRQLNFAARSSGQLREAMRSRDVPEPAAAEVIARLTRVGLIDDTEYAAMLVRTRQAERGLARRALMEELRRKGIDQVTAEGALEQVDDADEAAAAVALVRKRVSSMRTLEPTKRRNRLYGTLARKGYSASAARRAIDEVLTTEGLELY